MEISLRYWKDLDPQEKQKLLSRSETNIQGVIPAVQKILDRVKEEGDKALYSYTNEFDKISIDHLPLQVQPEEFIQANASLSQAVKEALDFAIDHTQTFHEIQRPKAMEMLSLKPGLLAGERATPIDSVGLYVPSGRGSFPSMLYMLAVPAQIAQVPRVVVVTPPGPEGKVDPAVLYACQKCGVHEVYRVGGAQAIGALTYGTESIKPVVKLTGPGSMYVTAAKRLVYSFIDVGLPAGPSESMVLADDSANPWNLSLDLLVEAEHGSDSQALLVTDSKELATAVKDNLRTLIKDLPEPRKTFTSDVLGGYGGILITDSIEEGAEVINEFAPEHLSLQTNEPFETLELIRNAGEILLGSNLPFSGANYATGANAVLPTGGKAKTYGPVSVRDFMKYSSVVFATPGGYQVLKDPVTTLCDYEGFPSHGNAFKKRK
ncbi:histidinol dehydrogenase [Spirochaeta cellobiosiphila]|uniref:histidinol dehydrogenase n=1 Tax=Spirochaeta cellobiosiphila TaxID=504483 RepID=UPI000414E9AA|nr:histidinol dehydrogenase [Spirochaeta cellobiosiphila]